MWRAWAGLQRWREFGRQLSRKPQGWAGGHIRCVCRRTTAAQVWPPPVPVLAAIDRRHASPAQTAPTCQGRCLTSAAAGGTCAGWRACLAARWTARVRVACTAGARGQAAARRHLLALPRRHLLPCIPRAPPPPPPRFLSPWRQPSLPLRRFLALNVRAGRAGP